MFKWPGNVFLMMSGTKRKELNAISDIDWCEEIILQFAQALISGIEAGIHFIKYFVSIGSTIYEKYFHNIACQSPVRIDYWVFLEY